MHSKLPKCLPAESDDIKAVLAILIDSFAQMEGSIDPPSSLNALRFKPSVTTVRQRKCEFAPALLWPVYFSHEKRLS